MPKIIVTDSGRALLADCLVNHKVLTIDKFIFSDDPTLTDASEPSTNLTVMPGTEVHRTDVIKAGKLSNDAVVFSTIIGSTVGDFYLNAMGLYSTGGQTLIAIAYFPRQKKIANNAAIAGNTLSKNFTIRLASIAAVTGITVNPQVWQVPEPFTSSIYSKIGHLHGIGDIRDLAAALNSKGNMLVGEMKLWPGATAPAGWFECDGAEYEIAKYPKLYAVLKGRPDSAGSAGKFRVPDHRGEFIRGWDHGRGVDLGRVLGSLQGDAVQKAGTFNGKVRVAARYATDALFRYGYMETEGDIVSGNFDMTYNYQRFGQVNTENKNAPYNGWAVFNIDPDKSRRTATETRGRNKAEMYIIKHDEPDVVYPGGEVQPSESAAATITLTSLEFTAENDRYYLYTVPAGETDINCHIDFPANGTIYLDIVIPAGVAPAFWFEGMKFFSGTGELTDEPTSGFESGRVYSLIITKRLGRDARVTYGWEAL